MANDLAAMEQPDEDSLNNNPYILSKDIGMGKKSFLNAKQPNNKNAPPPKYMDGEMLS